MTLPAGIDLDQYRTRAKELLQLARAADLAALDRLREHHPESGRLLAAGHFRLADAQQVIARENGFASWPRFQEYLRFRNAVEALDRGNLDRLRGLLESHPRLLHYRCHHGEWYESGYFAGAMLLHHVAGNPIRHPLPENILEVTRLLLAHGADPAAGTQGGWPTIGLLLTSKQASDAGVALPLIDLLRAAGAEGEMDLTLPLLNAAPGTARELARRGARMDLRHAAGLGRLDVLEALFPTHNSPALLEEALAFACIRGEAEAAQWLVDHGARGDVLVAPGGQTPRTALHEAANRGHAEIVRLLLEHGADPGVVEPHWGGMPAGWATHGGHTEIAELLRAHPEP